MNANDAFRTVAPIELERLVEFGFGRVTSTVNLNYEASLHSVMMRSSRLCARSAIVLSTARSATQMPA